MHNTISSIWIESEEKGAIMIGQKSIDDNSDVIVTFIDKTKYVATFFTYDNIQTLKRKNIETGECLSGKYFWASDMIIVDKIDRKEIIEVVDDLISENTFAWVFKKIEL